MAVAVAVACAAMPPLLPTPPPSTRLPEKKKIGSDAKPGRATSSKSWNVDKLLVRVSSSLPGRASLSANWNKDTSDLKELSRERRIDRKRSPSRAPLSSDRSDKKAKMYYAGTAFTVVSPDPSQLPIPKFVIKSPHPSELPMPSSFLTRRPPSIEANPNPSLIN